MGDDTQVIPAMQRRRFDRVKMWTPIIVALISLVGMLGVAWMQNRSSGRVDLVSAYVARTLVPTLQDKIERLLERQARIEGILEVMRDRPINPSETIIPKRLRDAYNQKVAPKVQSRIPAFKQGN